MISHSPCHLATKCKECELCRSLRQGQFDRKLLITKKIRRQLSQQLPILNQNQPGGKDESEKDKNSCNRISLQSENKFGQWLNHINLRKKDLEGQHKVKRKGIDWS